MLVKGLLDGKAAMVKFLNLIVSEPDIRCGHARSFVSANPAR
jgi:hypothetical protein